MRVNTLSDALGECERIFRTPIPLSYTRHTSRVLMVWLALLPLAMAPVAGWVTVPATALIATLLLGIEEIGIQLEEPFRTLPLGALCSVTARAVDGMYNEHDRIASVVLTGTTGDGEGTYMTERLAAKQEDLAAVHFAHEARRATAEATAQVEAAVASVAASGSGRRGARADSAGSDGGALDGAG